MFPSPDAIYGDLTSVLFYYHRHHAEKWTLVDRFLSEGQRITVHDVVDGRRHTVRVVRNKRQAFLSLTDPETYKVLAATLRHENLKSAVLFYEGLSWDDKVTKHLENGFRTLAPRYGLDWGRYTIGNSYAFIEFKLL
jgi:hypothetical protein